MLKAVGIAWTVVVGLLVTIGFLGIASTRGLAEALAIFGPINFWNFLLVALLLGPGFWMIGAGERNQKQARDQDSDEPQKRRRLPTIGGWILMLIAYVLGAGIVGEFGRHQSRTPTNRSQPPARTPLVPLRQVASTPTTIDVSSATEDAREARLALERIAKEINYRSPTPVARIPSRIPLTPTPTIPRRPTAIRQPDRYTLGEHTVTNSNLGIMWTRESPGAMTLEDAVYFCEHLSLEGYDDWRIPTADERLSFGNCRLDWSIGTRPQSVFDDQSTYGGVASVICVRRDSNHREDFK